MKSAHLPGSSEPVDVLHVRGVRGVDREQAQRFFARQLFLRIPAARRLAVAILARDGRVQAVERIRRARPGSRCRPRVAPWRRAACARHRRPGCASVRRDLRPCSCRTSRASAGSMRSLRAARTADVVERDDLRVLDPRAQRVTLLLSSAVVSNVSSTMRLPASPIACTFSCQPLAAVSVASSCICSRVYIISPRWCG